MLRYRSLEPGEIHVEESISERSGMLNHRERNLGSTRNNKAKKDKRQGNAPTFAVQWSTDASTRAEGPRKRHTGSKDERPNSGVDPKTWNRANAKQARV